jgi:uncharacterized protein involved in outer membrane biogenesis
MLKKVVAGAVILIVVAMVTVFLIARHMLGSENVRATLEHELSARLGQPVTIAEANASIFPRVTLHLRDVAIGRPVAATLKDVQIATGLRPLLSKRVEDAEVTLADSRLVLPLPFSLLTAAAAPGSAPPAPASASGGGITIVSVRVLALKNVEFVVGKHSLRFDMSSSLEGDRLDVKSLNAKSDVTRVDAKGTLTSIARLEGALDVKGDPLDLDELLAITSGLAETGVAGRAAKSSSGLVPMKIAIKLTAPKGRFAGYAFTDLSTSLSVVQNRITLDPLAFRMFGGRYQGRLDANTAGSTPALALNGQVEGIDVAELAKVAGSAGSITGKLSGRVTLTGQGADSDAVLRTARGSAVATIVDGKIPGLDMVRTIVLAFGKPNGAPPAGSGSTFSRLGGTFAIQNGIIRSGDLRLASRDFDLGGRGTMTLASSRVDAAANVTLSEELTSQSGTDLRRYAAQDGRVVVPAIIGGTLQQPSVSLNVAAAMQRAFQNELQRRANDLLGGLFKKKKQ